MKRVRISSAENAVKAMADSVKAPHSPPDHVRMRPVDMPFWEGIVASRARDEWSKADLVVAAQLARCQADLETEAELLEGEGTTGLNGRGTKVMNPRVSVLEGLARREMALMRALRMGGRVAGDPRDEQNRRRLQNQAVAIREEMADDELLAQ